MLSVPNQKYLFTTTSYTDIFMLEFLWSFGVMGMCLLGAFLLFLSLKIYCIRRLRKETNFDALNTFEPKDSL
jgi:hypothetical protein